MRQMTALLVLTLVTAGGARADVPRVVVDFAPTGSLVAQVMGGLGQPDVLVQGGADPHDYQMRPSQARAVEAADLVIWVGPELTPWLGRVLDRMGGGARLGLLADPGTPRRPYDGANGDSGATDPHAWLDPVLVEGWVRAIRDALTAADPGHADQYAANAARLMADLDRLNAQTAATLARVKGPIVVGHGAFGYFAARYRLVIAAAIQDGEAVAPGAAHLSRVRALLTKGEVACVFPVAGQDPAQAAQMVEGTGARLGPPLDPEAVALAPGANLYQRLIGGLADAIAACAGG